jgi:hypothetical protein
MNAINRCVLGLATGVLVMAAMPGTSAASYPTLFASDPTAEQLEARATSLFESPKRYPEAARLLVRAADLRDMGDPQRIENLRQASRLYFFASSMKHSRIAAERAAREALAVGHVFEAADALLDAASLAQQVGDTRGGADLLHRAQLLALSPLLSIVDRAALQSRIEATT